AASRAVAQSLVLQLACLHSPNDVRIAVVRSDRTAPEWDFVKWLPHGLDPDGLDGDVPARRVTSTVPAMQHLLEAEFEQRLARAQRARGRDPHPPEQLVVVVDCDGLTAHQHLA